jgi:uncharacterized protein
MRLSVLLATALVCASAQRTPDLSGTWLGTLEAGPMKLRLALHIERAEGGFKGTMDSLDQGANGIPLADIATEASNAMFRVPKVGGSYKGDVNGESTQIAGTWTQGGASLPLVFKRVASLPATTRPQEPKKPYPYDEEEVAYSNEKAGVKLAGTLTKPKTGAPFAAVLLITGSGPQDRDEAIMGHRPFLVLADHLTRRGIAVLRVDDRGVGKSTGSMAAATTEDFAGDVAAGIEFLKKRSEIDAKRIGLLGHSEGGVIAPMVAAKSSDVAFIVLLAGTAIPGRDLLFAQGEAVGKSMGRPDDLTARNRQLQAWLFDIVQSEKDPAAAAKRFEGAKSEAFKLMPEMPAEAMGQQFRAVNTPWMRFFLTFDPATALRQVKCPVLALNGELDTQVPASLNLPVIAKALEQAGNRDHTETKMPRLNHLFQTAKTGSPAEYGSIEETMSPAALEAIAAWVVSHTRK